MLMISKVSTSSLFQYCFFRFLQSWFLVYSPFIFFTIKLVFFFLHYLGYRSDIFHCCCLWYLLSFFFFFALYNKLGADRSVVGWLCYCIVSSDRNQCLSNNSCKLLICCHAFTGTWRVGGVLAVSRAFGDKLLKPYVVAEPEIQVNFFLSFLLQLNAEVII